MPENEETTITGQTITDQSPPAPPPKKPISEAKLAANRRNGALSKGPVTAEGKRRSSLNAYRSGLHGQIVCATAEELAVLQKHTSDVHTELAPVGPTESFLTTSISDNMFRINRIRALEAGILASGFRANIDSVDTGHPEVDAALVAADTWIRHAHEIHLLSVYESRLSSILRKDRADLKAVQAERKEACGKAADQAAIFVEHAESKGEVYEPGEDFKPASEYGGFVFSASEIARREDRKRRYDIAWKYHHRDRSKDPKPKLGPIIDVQAA
jgi:hypothetical protein